ncbi:hypothetical protein ACTA71_010137 [Dictyostelium dimigraforme]
MQLLGDQQTLHHSYCDSNFVSPLPTSSTLYISSTVWNQECFIFSSSSPVNHESKLIEFITAIQQQKQQQRQYNFSKLKIKNTFYKSMSMLAVEIYYQFKNNIFMEWLL